MLLTTCLVFPLVMACLMRGWAAGRLVALTALVPLSIFAALALLWAASGGGAAIEQYSWIPSLGITFSLRMDGLATLFALLISGIGSCIFLYASRYMPAGAGRGRFYTVLTLFMTAMLGAVLADDAIALLVFWELTSLTSFLLIGYKPESVEARRSAQQGLLLTVGGGLALLAGLILLGNAAGTYRLSEIVQQGSALAGHPSAGTIVVLLCVGAFAKSAQVPLHAWLPNAMVAPTPVSAYLHSATMVKLGVYLLARFHPAFSDQALWLPLLSVAGLATMLTATVLALRETDLKRVLAYSTVVSLGTLVTLLAQPGALAATAVVVFLLVHALYKACLFMVAGIVDHATGTRDIRVLGGLRRRMPLTAAVAVVAGLSMAGLPPLLGFVGKELIYEVGLASRWQIVAVGIALLANACMVLVAGLLTLRCFFGPEKASPDGVGLAQVSTQDSVAHGASLHAPHSANEAAHVPKDPCWFMLAGPVALSLLGLAFGLAPFLAQPLLASAASAIFGAPATLSLALWHGLTPMLALSVVTLALGALALWRWAPIQRYLSAQTAIDRYGPDRGYDHVLNAIMRFAGWQTRLIQGGSLRVYVGCTLSVIAVSVLATLFSQGGVAFPSMAGTTWQLQMVIPILLVIATVTVVRATNFMRGIIAAALVGFGIALTFLFQGAPDLAFTQFSVEVLSVVLLLAIIGKMPFRTLDVRTRAQRRRDACIAICFGLTAALVLFAVIATPFDTALSDFYRLASVPEAHGRNLVNVIIVDFRALDTLGEITVMALAALAAAAVIVSTPRAKQASGGIDREQK